MKYVFLALLMSSVFAGGENGNGVWIDAGTRVFNIDLNFDLQIDKDIRSIDEYIYDEQLDVFLVKTKSRVIALKSTASLTNYKKQNRKIKQFVDEYRMLGFSDEEAKMSVEDTINTKEVTPFRLSDFL